MKHLTNEEFVKRSMNYSRFGALKQAFLLEAVSKYAELCVEAGAKELDTPFISGRAWVGCAKEWKDELEAHLK